MEALLSTDGANVAVNPTCVPEGDEDDEGNVDGDMILVRAAREGNASAVQALVESGKEPDVKRAARNGQRPPSCRPSVQTTPPAWRFCSPQTASTPTKGTATAARHSWLLRARATPCGCSASLALPASR